MSTPENQPAASGSDSRICHARGSPPQQERGGDGDSEEEISCLDLSSSVIETTDAKLKARRLESGDLLELKVLFLQGNAGDLGMRAMLNAMRAGHLKKLEQLILLGVSSYDQLTEEEAGTDTIAEALRAGNLQELVLMDFTGTLPKVVPPRKLFPVIRELLVQGSCGRGRFSQSSDICFGCLWARPLEKGKDQTLECFRCLSGKLEHISGDDGVGKIVKALKESPITTLQTLLLQENHIRSAGAVKVAELLGSGLLPNLQLVDMRNNPVGYTGAHEIVRAFLNNPLLTVRVKLDWPSWLLERKAVAFRENNIRLEHMMKKKKISHEKIENDENYKYFQDLEELVLEECLEKQQGALFRSKTFVRKLLLHCQAHHDNYREKDEFRDHKVTCDAGGTAFVTPVSSPGPTPEGTPVAIPGTTPGATQVGTPGIHVRRVKHSGFDVLRRFKNQQFVTTKPPKKTKKQSESAREQSDAARAVHNVYCKLIDYSGACTTKAGKERLGQQMDRIKQELLMLAENKPDDFYEMFKLRQVLLKNPKKDKYSRLWICDSCFQEYERTGPEVVHPITVLTHMVN